MGDSHTRNSHVEYIPIKVKVQRKPFDLFKVIIEEIKKNKEEIKNGDIIVISSKFAAMSQGRIVNLSNVIPSKEAEELGKKLDMNYGLVETILKESEFILGGIPGFLLTINNGVLTPNAGIDKSNIFPNWIILQPSNPFNLAENLRKNILKFKEKKVGIILTDSRLMPTRRGTTGVSMGVAGFEPLSDERGRKDLFGNVLKVTFRALADDICGGAQLLMGEASEATPIVIVRFLYLKRRFIKFTERKITKNDLSVDYDECVYIRGLNYFKIKQK